MEANDWTFLVRGSAMAQWTPWSAFFRLVLQILDAIPAPGEPQRHFAVISSKIRDAMRINVPILTKHSFFDPLAFRLDAPGEEILQETFEAVLNLIARM
jgi:hypothetical protein